MNVKNFPHYLKLIRFDKPIGSLLLLWPTLWALWFANDGFPPVYLLFIFVAGTFLMRSAGCIINDLVDQKWDKHVARTQSRPLVTHKVSKQEALILLGILCLAAFLLVCLTNTLTVVLSLIAIFLTTLYPYTKRFTYYPQLFLGFAFAMSMPMAFTATQDMITGHAVYWYIVGMIWPLIYDTFYAMVDEKDDINIGIKSTAVRFGKDTFHFTLMLQIVFFVLLITGGVIEHLHWPYFISLIIAGIQMFHQQQRILTKNMEAYFKAFLDTQWIGLTIFIGIVISYLIA